MGIIQEFRDFALKGNAFDMAVGIIIGAAFNKIVSSMVSDVIMPPIGYVLGGVDFRNLEWVFKPASVDAAGVTVPAVSLRYGAFISTVIDFLIIAFTVFIMVKAMNRMMRRSPAKAG
jgi:large conductance mechanosensitive channel